jgi:hypothetical protein
VVASEILIRSGAGFSRAGTIAWTTGFPSQEPPPDVQSHSTKSYITLSTD